MLQKRLGNDSLAIKRYRHANTQTVGRSISLRQSSTVNFPSFQFLVLAALLREQLDAFIEVLRILLELLDLNPLCPSSTWLSIFLSFFF